VEHPLEKGRRELIFGNRAFLTLFHDYFAPWNTWNIIKVNYKNKNVTLILLQEL